MKTTMQAIQDGFTFEVLENGQYASFKFGPNKEYELCIEPLLFGQMMVALYEGQNLLTEKVPFKPIDKEDI